MLYISTSCINEKSLSRCLSKLGNAGITNVELSGGTSFVPLIQEVLLECKRKFSFNYLLHNYFPPPKNPFVLNIASFRSGARAAAVEFIKRSIDLSALLGADRYMFHAGYAVEMKPPSGGHMFRVDSDFSVDKTEAWERMFESLYEINEYGLENGIRIGLENLFPFEDDTTSLLVTFEELRQYLAHISELANIGLLLDLGHLNISAAYHAFNRDEVVNYIRENHHHKLLGLHLSENDGTCDAHLPLSGKSWQLRAVEKLYTSGLPMTLESRGLSVGEILSQQDLITGKLQKE